jgi:hypothetical protein
VERRKRELNLLSAHVTLFSTVVPGINPRRSIHVAYGEELSSTMKSNIRKNTLKECWKKKELFLCRKLQTQFQGSTSIVLVLFSPQKSAWKAMLIFLNIETKIAKIT